MKKRYLSVLLALSLSVNTMPTIAFAEDAADTPTKNESETPQSAANADEDTPKERTTANVVYTKNTSVSGTTETGDGTQANPYAHLSNAVQNVSDGGTIYVLGTGYANDMTGQNSSVIINKKVTIQGLAENGSSGTATLDVRAAGIILGTDVTIKDINLNMSNPTSAIFVNGHKLTAENVKSTNTTHTAHIFAGGLSSDSTTAGSKAEINLTNCTFGNIYAGGMGETFSGDVAISLTESTVDAVYGGGAGSSVSTADTSKGTSGDVTLTLTDNTKLTKIDGDGAKSLSLSVSCKNADTTTEMKNVNALHITSGTYGPSNAPESNLAVTLGTNAALDLSASTAGAKEIASLSGGGGLILDMYDTLTIGTVSGAYTLETRNNSVIGVAENNHTYITKNSGDGTFQMASGCLGNMQFTSDTGGKNWATSTTQASTTVTLFAVNVNSKNISKTSEEINAKVDDGGGAEVKVLFTGASYLTDVPIYFKLGDVLSMLPPNFGTADSTNDNSIVIENFKLTVNDVAIDGSVGDGVGYILIEKNENDIPEGTYNFTISAPTASGSTITDTFTLTVGNSATTPTVKTLDSISVTTAPTKTTYTAGETFDPTGMVVTATYSDGTSGAITGYTTTPDTKTPLTTADTSVTISYTEGNVTKETTQNITVTPVVAPSPVEKQDITKDMFQVQITGLTYTGENQRTQINTAIGRKEAYKDKFGGLTIIVKPKNDTNSGDLQSVTEVGEYNIYVTCTGDTEYNAVTELFLCTISMKPREISVDGITVTPKTFDGTTDLSKDDITAVTFNHLPSGATFIKDTDYEIISCQYKTANVESLKRVIYTIRLLNNNYTFANSNDTVSGEVNVGETIKQADAPTNLTSETVYRKTGSTISQEVSVASVGMPANAGTLSYAIDDNSAIYTTNKDKFSATIDADTGILTITSVTGKADELVVIPILISSTNYKDAPLSVTIKLTEKDLPTISAEDISQTYTGAPLLESLIKGTAEFGSQTVAGKWSWSGTAPENVADSGQISVTFTPDDTENYAPATTDITVIIKRANLTGAPTYTKITTSDKTLADANLTANPDWLAKTTGTLEWLGNTPDTGVTQGTAYEWVFTPDNNNYEPIHGKIILWEKPITNNSGNSNNSGGSSNNGSGNASSVSTSTKVPVSSAQDSVNVSASVSQGTASVEMSKNQMDTIISSGETNVTVDVSGLKNVDSAKLPADIITAANQANEIGVTVALPTGSVTLDEQALSSIADGKDVTVSVETVTPAALTDTQKAAIGDQAETALVVDVNVLVGKEKQSTFGNGILTISVPYTLKDGEDAANLTVWFIHDDGTIENMGGSYDTEKKCFTFETKHLSKYVLMSLPEKEPTETPSAETQNPATQAKSFVDVPADAYYADAVAWASANGIASGVGDALFAPNRSCTRAQVVTFFWRFADKPAATQATAFGDVESGAYYSEAVRWAAEQGIVSGYPNGQFGTDDVITREQMVTFLYRFAQSSGIDTTQGGMAVREFSDYESISGYARSAMQWAVNVGILKGSDGYLMPDAPCTRAEIISLLYRLHNLNLD